MSAPLAEAWPPLDHLQRMSDHLGLFEHACYDVPRREHGYCVDDVARGLVLVCREAELTPDLVRLAAVYLAFVVAAVRPDGCVVNRMNASGEWTDTASLDDCWGRALWGLGVAAVHAPTEEMRTAARTAFRTAATRRSPYLKAAAFAALGAGVLLIADPGELSARLLLRDLAGAVGPLPDDAAWPWPEPWLSYGNGAIVEALLLAGTALPDPGLLQHGLVLLDFLLRTESRDGHLSVTPVAGRLPGDAAHAFDQQPIEVAAIADACARAYDATGDLRWQDGVLAAWAWFLGDNDSRTVMFDASTGAGFDGLMSHGANLNQGAESTLAMLATARQAERMDR